MAAADAPLGWISARFLAVKRIGAVNLLPGGWCVQVMASTSDKRSRRLRHGVVLLLNALALSGCVSGGGDSETDSALSRFEEGPVISGRVLENSRACEVDAVCYLRIEFADTTVVAVYGTGERPAPPCTMTVEVSDVAFQVEPGAMIDAVILKCDGEGHYLQSIQR